MPIEIRELVVRATVDPHSTGQGAGSCGGGGGASQPRGRGAAASGAPGTSGAAGASGADPDVVRSCVREVMRILEEKRER